MSPYWTKVDDVTAGVDRLRMLSWKYLPRFPDEDEAGYRYRVENSVLTDIFGDIVGALASKPFTKEAGLYDDDPPPEFVKLVEDVDRSGDHLHVFAQAVFHDAIAYGLDWIMVDHTRLPEGATLADERRMGARPYLVRIAARDMLWVKSGMTPAGEAIIFAKINESYVDDDGNTVVKVRVLHRDAIHAAYRDDGTPVGDPIDYGPPRFEVWEERDGAEASLVDSGPITLDVIPLIPFCTGRRIPGTWRFTLPMKPIIELQIEHYQADTNLKVAKQQTCFPMLVARGIAPPKGDTKIPVGPKTVLYAPMGADGKFGDWKSLEPSTESLRFLASEVKQIEMNMRELGRMPLTADSAGITAIAAQMASERSNSAAQSWVFTLKDTLERAFDLMAKWMGSDYKAEVRIDTDFAVSLTEATEPALLKSMTMPDSGQAPVMSIETFYSELRRRGIIAPEITVALEKQRLEDEATFRRKIAEEYPAVGGSGGGSDEGGADRRIGAAPSGSDLIPDVTP